MGSTWDSYNFLIIFYLYNLFFRYNIFFKLINIFTDSDIFFYFLFNVIPYYNSINNFRDIHVSYFLDFKYFKS